MKDKVFTTCIAKYDYDSYETKQQKVTDNNQQETSAYVRYMFAIVLLEGDY